MVSEGILGAYGVSIETVEQGLRAIERPGVATVQVIFNAFRLKPLEKLLPACAQADVGVIVRVPLASGLLSGRYDEHTTFPPSDHRTYNRHGEAFDVGETFSGVPYDVGVAGRQRLANAVPEGWSLPEVALRWCADAPGVSTVIPVPVTPPRPRPMRPWGAASSARRSRGRDQGHLRRRSTHLRRRPLVIARSCAG